MSAADLLGDLDSFYHPKSQTGPNSQVSQQVQKVADQNSSKQADSRSSHTQEDDSWAYSSTAQAPSHRDDDDDWGEFESATTHAPDQSITRNEIPVDPWELNESSNKWTEEPPVNNDQFNDQNSNMTRVQMPFNESRGQPSLPTQAPRTTTKPAKVPRDDNVLFDAEYDFDDDDDFGDFEDTSSSQPQPQPYKITMMPIEQPKPIPEIKKASSKPAQSSLIEFDWDASEAGFNEPVLSPTAGDAANAGNPASNNQTTPSNLTYNPPASQTPHTWNVVDDSERDWDDFIEAEPSPEPEATNSGDATYKPATDSQRRSGPLDLPELLAHNDTQSSVAAPSNIPPPAVLLPLFPPNFSIAQKQLFEPLSQHTNMPSTRVAILSHPSTERFLESYVTIASVLGHIIAGRKLRWKRDGLLSQSMSIGPASTSGKSAGMKLTSVDKTENAREERELADVLKSWRIQIGKLRSAITGSMPQAKIPELSETLPVRIATQSEGGVVSPRQCALCGLKRNERVTKVDFDVQDAFGEWWTEHWGHRACRNFWDSQKQQLHGR